MSLKFGSMIYFTNLLSLDVPSVALGNGRNSLTLAGADGPDASRSLQLPCGPAAQHDVRLPQDGAPTDHSPGMRPEAIP